MKEIETERYNEMARISKSLAHPSRLLIVDKLKDKSYNVHELTELVGSDISTVSKHLSLLKNSGIISPEKRGNKVYYHLRCRCVLGIFSCVLDVMQNNVKSSQMAINFDLITL